MISQSILICLACAVLPVISDDLWTQFKKTYGKDYSAREDIIRRKIFEENAHLIAKHNLEADLNLHSFRLGMNHFADMTNEEFRAYTSSLVSKSVRTANHSYHGYDWEVPDEIDWTTRGIVTPVSDQGSCRSSYAFAAVASIEGQYALYNGVSVKLSEQQVIECSNDFGNDGCDGGDVQQSFRYIELTGGLDSRETYESNFMQSICQFDRQHVVARLAGFVSVAKDELVLKDAVSNVGPVAVTLDAFSFYFQFYSSGILSHIECSNRANHAMIITGYGSEDGKDFWLLKNSWSTDWGQEGYMRLGRNENNLCNISSNAVYPLLRTF